MADNAITMLDENGGTVQDKLHFQKADNGSGFIHKNHSITADYGMQVCDVDSDLNKAILQISGELQQANLIFQKANENASRYELYHSGNKPTPSIIGAVSKTGDTMTGSLEIEKADSPTIKLHNTTSDSASTVVGGKDTTYVAVYNVDGDEKNCRSFAVIDSINASNVKDSLCLIDNVNGTTTSYKLYGTHNKPTPDDIGAIPASGGVLSGALTVKPYDNGYGIINKNNSTTADYGMQLRDVSSSDKVATLIVSAVNQKASLALKSSADGTTNTYEIYHEGNKPTPTEIGAAPSYTYGTTNLVPGSSTLATGKLYFVYE